MRKICVLLSLVGAFSIQAFSQDLDPLWEIWKYEHGMDFEEFTNASGDINYYVTWSSSAGTAWIHDIYSKTISFDVNGSLQVLTTDQNYIGEWEAQEPVTTAINPDNNYILSVFEDGGQSDITDEAVNISAQLHKPDGSVIKSYFQIADGPDAQHSPTVGHIGNKFIALYGDDYSGASTQIRAKVLDDVTGDITQSIDVTPASEYHWWPVYASNDEGNVGFSIWVKDIEDVAGSIVTESGGIISTSPYQVYLTGAEFCYNRVIWLEKIKRFAIINKTVELAESTSNSDVSLICLVDENGNKTLEAELQGAIIQEGEPAAMWDTYSQSYIFVYPTGNNDLVVAKVNNNEIVNHSVIEGDNNTYLNGITWTNTGIMSRFIKDVNGNQVWNNQYIALFALGNYNTNEAHLLPIRINTDIFGSTSTINPPVVNISSPAGGAEYTSPAIVVINADATDSDGSVTKVEFFQNGSLLGEDTSSPYSFTWSDIADGNYALTAVATSNAGETTTSAAVNISVGTPSSSQAPYGGIAWEIPGVIEAENYDNGGEGIAYHDASTGNSGNAYRTDNVDIEDCSDNGGGYDVGGTTSGEWMEYTVNIESSGSYIISTRVATLVSGTQYKISIDDIDLTDVVDVPNTGDWQTWQTVSGSAVELSAGEHVMRLDIVVGDFNINSIEFTKVLNQVSTAMITSPTERANYTSPAIVVYDANATDSDGSATKVELSSIGLKSAMTNKSLEEGSTDIVVYPNHVQSIFYIETGNPDGLNNIKIYNLYGSLISERQTADGEAIDISEYNSGVYLININNTDIKRLIKK